MAPNALYCIERDKLIGTYALVGYQVKPPTGEVWDWTPISRGYLFYSVEGLMSGALNFDVEKAPVGIKPPDRAFLFYSGPYEITEKDLVHKVEIASDLSWVGRRLSRLPSWDEKGHLVLQGKGAFGLGILTWKKIKSAT